MIDGLPTKLNVDIRTVIRDCSSLKTDDIEEFFVRFQLPFRDMLPDFEGKKRIERIEALVSFLLRNSSGGENGLVLFLGALKTEHEAEDGCFDAIQAVIDQTMRFIEDQPPLPPPPPPLPVFVFEFGDLRLTLFKVESGWEFEVKNVSDLLLRKVSFKFTGSDTVWVNRSREKFGDMAAGDASLRRALGITVNQSDEHDNRELIVEAAYLRPDEKKAERVKQTISFLS